VKTIYKSIAIGCAIEAVSVSLFAFGGFGPCGPSNPIGLIGMLMHIFPGMFVAAGIQAFVNLPDWLMTIVIILSQAVFWSVITFLVVRIESRMKNEI